MTLTPLIPLILRLLTQAKLGDEAVPDTDMAAALADTTVELVDTISGEIRIPDFWKPSHIPDQGRLFEDLYNARLLPTKTLGHRRQVDGAGASEQRQAAEVMSRFQVDELDFELRTSDRRKTLGITVDRGGELVLAAPKGVHADALRDFVREKRFWIYKKLTEKEQLQRTVPKKEYVNGEGFLYLGRSYRLKLVDDQDEPLKLIAGRFCLRRDEEASGREHFIRWYSSRGREWLSGKVRAFADRIEVAPGRVNVQELGYRWGSCGKGGALYFHWKAMMLPREIAEYVVVHELIHLHHPHHTPRFWQLLERAMPDFLRRKAWLAAHGIDVEGV